MVRLKSGSLWWGTLALLAISVMVNVAQAHRLRSVLSSDKPSFLLGRSVRPLPVVDLDGRPAVIRFNRRVPTVLYYFSTSCHWCERNWDNISEVANRAGGRYRVVAIASETALADFVAKQNINFEVYGGVTEETRNALALSGTPRTVVVSAQGILTHDWTGAFSGSIGLAVEELFGVALPGLRPTPSKPAQSK